ncbi:MAG TPA: hypothetical protein VGM57_08605 [Pseudolabrys sp.]|jgi:hypothetical protein
MTGKRVQFDPETWASVDLLAKDRMMTFQELADEAFRDILRKYDRPFSLKEALRKSAGVSADIVVLNKNRTAAKSASNRGKNKPNKSAKKRM